MSLAAGCCCAGGEPPTGTPEAQDVTAGPGAGGRKGTFALQCPDRMSVSHCCGSGGGTGEDDATIRVLLERLHAENSPGWRRESNFETAHERIDVPEEETVVGGREKAVGAETEAGNQGAEEYDV